jgi:LmbE family N-acetylglucosaminyl deacetylase
MLSLPVFANVREVLCIGAHCDDIEIGCGGALRLLAEAHPECRLHFVVLSGGGGGRGAETRHAIAHLLRPAVRFDISVHDFRDGFFPAEWESVKAAFEALKAEVRPDLVFTHYGDDRHQDHRIVSELTWNTFRNHMILEYEIPKWDGDLGRPQVFVPLDKPVVDHKITAILESFASQRGRSWFTAEVFAGLMRLRGMECNAASGYAEAFHVRKLVVN